MEYDYNELEFVHFVIRNDDGAIFGSTKDNGNYLISDSSVRRQVSEDWWQPVAGKIAEIIRRRAHEAYGKVPTYRTKNFAIY